MKMNHKSLLSLVLSSLLICGGMISCGKKSSSSSSGGFNNNNNFIESSREVNSTKLVVYDGPSYLKSKEGYNIKVEDTSLFVYETRVNHSRKFSWNVPSTTNAVVTFDFEGKVHMEISIDGYTITSAYISPRVYDIKTTIKNNVLSFDLSYSGNYVVELNDDYETAIHIFANPIETNPITEEEAKNDDSITYIGPGVYYSDAIPAKSNSTIYLAGGSYVYGNIRMEGLENVTIRGRGIISGSIFSRNSESEYTIPVEIRTCKNITLEDITFLDPAGWAVALFKSQKLTLNNIKIISARQNGDGISVQSCSNVNVSGGFVRTWDDSLVVKNVQRGSTDGVHFNGVIVWTDLAQSMEVGYETYGPTMNDISFENITIIHNFHKAAISMHNCDDANITNVTYKNITVEDAAMLGDNQTDGLDDYFIDFTIAYNEQWTKSEGIRGSINGVTIDNVKIYKIKDTIISRMSGESSSSSIKNVSISNIEIEGKTLKSKKDLSIVENNYVENVKYEHNSEVIGAKIALPYKLILNNINVDKAIVNNIEQEGMLVPEFAYLKGELTYIGVPSSVKATSTVTHGAGTKTTTPADDGSGDFTASGSSSSYATDGNLDTYWRSGEWKNQENEFAALTMEFDKPINVGVIRILGNQNNRFHNTYTIEIFAKKVKGDGSVSDKYTRLKSFSDYEMSPSNGNCIDLNITTQQYQGLQLRFFRTSAVGSPLHYEVCDVKFYPPSLTFGKSIVESSEHNDVYPVEKLIDGDATGTSYYESKSLPATVVVDLGDLYSVNTFVLCLPPSLMWDARTQEIEILGSDSNLSYSSSTIFKTLVNKTKYLFDPATGNKVIITIEATQVRFLKLVISSNDISGGYGAQLSEFSVYGD